MRTIVRKVVLLFLMMMFATLTVACEHQRNQSSVEPAGNSPTERPPLNIISDAARLEGLSYYQSDERGALLRAKLQPIGLQLAEEMISGRIPAALHSIKHDGWYWAVGRVRYDTPPQNGYGHLHSIMDGSKKGDYSRIDIEVKITNGRVDLSDGVYGIMVDDYYFGDLLQGDNTPWKEGQLSPPSRNGVYELSGDNKYSLFPATNASDTYNKEELKHHNYYGMIISDRHGSKIFVGRDAIENFDKDYVKNVEKAITSIVPYR